MRLALDHATRRFGTTLAGGAPLRLLRLSSAGPDALRALAAGDPTPAQRRLGERLVDAGLAHPLPAPAPADVTLVIPVRDRPAELDRCLATAAQLVVVVDDGSRDPAAIAAVAARHGAGLVRRERSGGPAAARNAAAAGTELVAFLDSDCVAPPGWIEALAGHFADPRVAAVAPRVAARPLDMGPHPAAVRPDGRVRYVPSAALVVRRAALPRFDEALRYGEDVDLVWRLHDAGWRVRYDPRVVVAHPAVGLRRRFAYGTSAAPLAARHPGRLAPLVLRPWPALAVALLLARRPVPRSPPRSRPWRRCAGGASRRGSPPAGARPRPSTRGLRPAGRRPSSPSPAPGCPRRRRRWPTASASTPAACAGARSPH